MILIEGNANSASEGSIFGGLVEESMELPKDGLNGDCIVHYNGDNSEYELVVTLVNGVKEGMAILYCDGIPTKKCEYRNGVFTGHVEEVAEWKLILSKGIDSKESILFYDIKAEYTYGVVKCNERYCAVDGLRGAYRMVVADVNRMEMIICEDSERTDPQCTKEVIDLDVNGKRWEGGVRDGKPFGYGVVYDEEGRKEYEGFMVGGVKVCYGIEYCSNNERVNYRGCFLDGIRFGKGNIYDRNGMIVYCGLWRNGKPYSYHFDGNTIDCHTESVRINDGSFSDVESFILHSFFYSLTHFVIGDDCFGRVRLFELDGLHELENVVIGQSSFRIGGRKRSDGSCRIVNCPKLKSIQIGFGSFWDYHSFELNNLPSLQSIDMGEYCFNWAASFSLTGLIGGLVLIHISSSTTISQSWLCYISVYSFGCV